ncbi:MAG TPA: helix-turn-helix domain-containing protein [Actinocrinis sp.]|nr:helix-turn-helix domain-containing protein [Actinocrinis sp.]
MTSNGIGRGVLRPVLAAERFELLRREPTGPAAEFVEFHWIVRWDLRGRPAHPQQVLSHPNVHLVFEEPGPFVYGVQRGLFERRLTGAGRVFGVKFLPGGFRPLLGSPVLDLVDRRVPAADLFGPAVVRAQREVLGASDPDAMRRAAEEFLRGVLPEPDPTAREAAGIVARITEAPTLFRVDQLAAETGLSVRSLQRLFAEYVGAGPKWVLRRARLHEAAARAEQATEIDWSALATDLGYADQAHLTRDFTATVGAPPARYART